MTSSTAQSIAQSIRNLHPLFVAVVLALLCLASYSNCFNNGFLMDDYPMLIKNPTITSAEFLHIDLSDRGAGIPHFRPVDRWLRYINYSLFGDQPAGYHAVNLVFFYLGCLALYHLLIAVFKNRPLAFLTVLLFAAHPINSILVDYKNATYFAALLLLMALGMLFALNAIKERNAWLNNLLSFFCCALALLSHEVAVAFPLYLAVILYFGCGRSLKETFVRALPSTLLVGIYILFRFFFFSVRESVFANLNMPFLSYTASLAKAIGVHIAHLNGLQDILLAHNATALPSEVFICNVLFLIVIALFGVYLYLSPRNEPGKLGVLWFITGLLPLSAACLSRPMFGFAMEPHWMIFGSVGFFIFLASILLGLREKLHPKLWKVIIILILAAYVMHTRHYNYLWANQERYCRYWLSVAPESSWASYWLAYDRMENKDYIEAEKYFQKSLTGTTADAASYTNLGYIKRIGGRFNEAVSDYEHALRLDPKNAETYFWLGYVQWKLNDAAKAEWCFQKAIKLNKTLITAVNEVKSSPR